MTEPGVYASAYREQLPGKLEAVRLAALNLPTAPREATDSLRRLAHSLQVADAAGGYPQVSVAAARVLASGPGELPAALAAMIVDFDEVQVSAAARQVLAAGPTELPAAVTALITVLDEVIAGHGAKPDTTILLIDDDDEFRTLLASVLTCGGRRILEAGDAATALALLDEQPVALVVLDLILGDTDGRNLLIKLRENPRTAVVPVIVVSGKLNPAIKAECYALGADGYFEKPFEPKVLAAAVTTRLEQSRRQVREARTDLLTGLPNRAAFIEAFARAHAHTRRSGAPLAVAILDLDNFKRVNDTYGHAVGDAVLRRLAEVLPGTLRQTDLLARWGGEEFVLLFPGAAPEAAVGILNKARETFKRETFRTDDGRSFAVTFSAGVAMAAATATAAETVCAADRFLYLAKEGGRDRVAAAAAPELVLRHRVLVVDDDDIVVMLIEQQLSGEGFAVTTFSNGTTAAAALTALPFSLAILDVQLPGMDGFDLLQKLRQQPGLAAVPVLMLTGRGDERDIARGLALGADDYMVKPFLPSELLVRIRRLLKRCPVAPGGGPCRQP